MISRLLTTRTLVLALGGGALLGCTASSDDSEDYFELDRLRVLAVRSTPADLVAGETATLNALVFEPKDREITYAWSWCPARADASGGFECTIDEAAFRKAWAATGSTLELPAYDLGNEAEAQFFDAITPEALPALCAALTQKSKDREQAGLACLYGLEISVKLVVKSGGKQVTAYKTLTLVPPGADPAARNNHPQLTDALSVRDISVTPPKSGVKTLQAGHRYAVTTEADDSVAESFVPEPSSDDPKPERRRETLIMSWFVTDGEFVNPDPNAAEDPFNEGSSQTTFVDGSNKLKDVLINGWELPLTAGPEEARLIVVLRDERGGTAWSEHRFPVKEKR